MKKLMYISAALDSHRNTDLPTHFLLDVLYLIFERNYFRFGTLFHLQFNGVAMGISGAPSMTNLFMLDWESRFILFYFLHTFFYSKVNLHLYKINTFSGVLYFTGVS